MPAASNRLFEVILLIFCSFKCESVPVVARGAFVRYDALCFVRGFGYLDRFKIPIIRF